MEETEYAQVQNVFATFGCQTLGDYQNLCLKTDTLLIACVVEEFRKLCYDTYGLDSAHYFTSCRLSRGALIKLCRADLHLLTDREHIEMAENMIRGGIVSIFSKRFFRANNKYMTTFKPVNESSFGRLIEANNLYGGVMEKLPLPLKDFQKVEIPLQDILYTDIDSDVGDVVEVDLEYPDYLNDQRKYFPPAPTKQNMEGKFLSDFQQNLLEKWEEKN